MEKELPCECAKITETYFFLRLDTNKRKNLLNVKFLKYGNIDFDRYNFTEESDGKYKVYREDGDSTFVFGHLQFNNDTLYFSNNRDKKSTFINYKGVNENGESSYYKLNVLLLNNSFIKRGYSSLEQILGEDSLNCRCNEELGTVDLISTEKRTKKWIIEQRKDSTFIYDFVNSSEGKSIPFNIIKRFLKSYKW